MVDSTPTVRTAGASDEEDRRFVDPLVAQIRQLWRNRQVWHRSEKSLTLQMSALCRGHVGVQGKGDKPGLKRAADLLKLQTDAADTIMDRVNDGDEVAGALFPLLFARMQLEPRRAEIEKTLTQLAKQLPIAGVVEQTKGFGLLSLAGIVGEAGAIGEYRTVQGLWKRMGLAVIEGERQRKKSDADEALLHGYSPPRRSVMWNIGGGLIGHLGHGPRPRLDEDVEAREELSEWQKMFLHRLRHEAAADPEHRRPDAERKGEVWESYSKHAANRARRYVEKQFLKWLWQQWRAA